MVSNRWRSEGLMRELASFQVTGKRQRANQCARNVAQQRRCGLKSLRHDVCSHCSQAVIICPLHMHHDLNARRGGFDSILKHVLHAHHDFLNVGASEFPALLRKLGRQPLHCRLSLPTVHSNSCEAPPEKLRTEAASAPMQCLINESYVHADRESHRNSKPCLSPWAWERTSDVTR